MGTYTILPKDDSNLDIGISGDDGSQVVVIDSATQTVTVTENVINVDITPGLVGSLTVDSVNGQTGVVVLDTDNIQEDANPTNKYYTEARFTTSLAASDTDGLPQGATNKYFANSLARNAISSSGDIAYDSSTGVISFVGTPGLVTSVNGQGGSVVLDTDDIAEGTGGNIYFTSARFNEKFNLKTTDDLPESSPNPSNLYWTQVRTQNVITANSEDFLKSINGRTGPVATMDTDDLPESNNPANKYYTNARARLAVTAVDSGGDGALVYNNTTGVFTYTGPNAAEVRAHLGVANTAGGDGSLAYDASTGIYTFSGPTPTEVRAHFSVDDQGGDGSLAYDNSTGVTTYVGPSAAETQAHFSAVDTGGDGSFSYADGVYTYTGPSSAEVRAHITAGEGIDFSGGVISGEDASYTNKGIAKYNIDEFYVDGGTVNIAIDGIDSTHIDFGTGANQVSTTDLPEGSNLYYTTARWDTKMAAADTDDLAEGSNLYYTDARARDSISRVDAGGDGSFEYNSTTGVMTYTGPSAAEVRAHISRVDAGGDGSFDYNSSTGVMTYTGPSAAEVYAHFTGGTGVTFNNGDISIGQPVGTTDDVSFGEVTATEFIGPVRGGTIFQAKATEALSKGDAVYIDGISGNKPTVAKADANDSNKMPAFGLANTDANTNANVDIIVTGQLTNIDTSGFTLGANLYVSNTAGELTDTPPTGEASQLQNLGKVERVHATTGTIFVTGAGRSNATPNLDDGKVFIGDSNDQSSTATLNTALVPELTNLYYLDSRARAAMGVNDTGGDGALTYNTTTGVYTYTGPSEAEVQAHITKAYVDGLDIQAASVDPNSVALGTDTTGNYIATIVGTANEVTVAGSGSESSAVTVGLPDDVTVTNNLTVGGNTVVTGNLTVSGTTTTVDTTNLLIKDNLFKLNKDASGTPSKDSGMIVERGDEDNAAFIWDESAGNFTLGTTTATGSEPTISVTKGTLNANLTGDVTGDVTGDTAGTHTGPTVGAVTGDVTGNLTGNVTGNVTGDLTGDVTGDTAGTHTGAVIGNVTGNVQGDLTGDVTGDLTGDVTGDVTGNLTGNVDGNVTGNVTGDVTGNLTGDVTGDVDGDLTGDVTGNLTGNVTGNLTGDVTGDVTGDLTGDVTGNVTSTGTSTFTTVDVNGGNIDGTIIGASTTAAGSFTTVNASSTITGNLSGNVTGNVTGDVTGDVDGDLTGDVTGNVTGNVDGILGGTTPAAASVTTLNASSTITGDVTGDLTGNVTGNVSGSSGTTTSISNHDTDDLTQGTTNKYYASSLFNTDLATKDTDDLAQGTTNKYYASSLFNTDLATKDTDDLTEGSNLYYTDARVLTKIQATNIDQLSNVNNTAPTDGQVLKWDNTNSYWKASEVAGDTSGVVTLTGTQTLSNKTLADPDVTGTLTGNVSGNVTGDLTGDVTGTVSSISNHDTDGLSEGSNNLYYTNDRVDAHLNTTVTGTKLTAENDFTVIEGTSTSYGGPDYLVGPGTLTLKTNENNWWASQLTLESSEDVIMDMVGEKDTNNDSYKWAVILDPLNNESDGGYAGDYAFYFNKLYTNLDGGGDIVMTNRIFGAEDHFNMSIFGDFNSASGGAYDYKPFHIDAEELLVKARDSHGSTEEAMRVKNNGITFYDNYTFPTDDGDDKKVLTTDGNGTLDWEIPGVLTVNNGSPNNDGDITLTTANISEGSNLYYTDARVLTKINSTSIDALSDVDTTTSAPSDGQILKWVAANSKWEPTSITSDADIVTLTATQTLTNKTLTNPTIAKITDIAQLVGPYDGNTGTIKLTGSSGHRLVLELGKDGEDINSTYARKVYQRNMLLANTVPPETWDYDERYWNREYFETEENDGITSIKAMPTPIQYTGPAGEEGDDPDDWSEDGNFYTKFQLIGGASTYSGGASGMDDRNANRIVSVATEDGTKGRLDIDASEISFYDKEYSFPTSGPSDGQVLTGTNGTGLAWETPAISSLTAGTGLTATGSGSITVAIDSSVTTNTGTQTLTNKTLTTPTITTPTITSPTINGTPVFTNGDLTTPGSRFDFINNSHETKLTLEPDSTNDIVNRVMWSTPNNNEFFRYEAVGSSDSDSNLHTEVSLGGKNGGENLLRSVVFGINSGVSTTLMDMKVSAKELTLDAEDYVKVSSNNLNVTDGTDVSIDEGVVNIKVDGSGYTTPQVVFEDENQKVFSMIGESSPDMKRDKYIITLDPENNNSPSGAYAGDYGFYFTKEYNDINNPSMEMNVFGAKDGFTISVADDFNGGLPKIAPNGIGKGYGFKPVDLRAESLRIKTKSHNNIDPDQMEDGDRYEIMTLGNTPWSSLGWPGSGPDAPADDNNPTVGDVFTADGPANAGTTGVARGAEVVNTSVFIDETHVECKVPIMPPKLSETQRDNLTPIEGMIIYNMDEARVEYYDNEWKYLTGTAV